MHTEAANGGSGLAPRQIHIVMIAVMTGMFLASLDGTIVITALPTIVGDLGNLSQAPWITVAYLLTQTIATPIIGKLSDIYGRKQTFQATISLFLGASMLCALAQNMSQLVLLRALQGLGAGGLLSLPMAIVGDILPPAERARYQGYIAGTFALASLIGPLAGGFFVDYLNWRWVFFVNLPIGAVSMIAVQRRLHLTRELTNRSIDYLGAVALTAATAPLIIALLWGGEKYGWSSPPTVTLFVLAGAATVLFILIELRAEEPIVPMSMFSNSIVRTTMIGSFTSGIGLYGVTAFVAMFLQVVGGTSATVSGLLTVPNAVAITVASVVSGRFIARTGNYKPYPVLGVALLAFGALLLATMDVHTSRAGVAIRLLICGLGIGQIGPSLTIIVQNAVDYRDLGVATAGLSFIRSLGGSIGTAVLGAVYATQLNNLIPRYVGPEAMATLPNPDALRGQPSAIRQLPQPTQSDVLHAFADAITHSMRVAIPVLLVTLVVFAFIPKKPLRDSHEAGANASAQHNSLTGRTGDDPATGRARADCSTQI
jgi:EmrB/QacA subfamily drug resistance transporter